jgi:hypothetical protein
MPDDFHPTDKKQCPKCKTFAKVDEARYCINCGERFPDKIYPKIYSFDDEEIIGLEISSIYDIAISRESDNSRTPPVISPILKQYSFDDEISDLERPAIYQIKSRTNHSAPIRGSFAGTCPLCGHPMKWRRAEKNGELYRGCDNFDGFCHYQERSY